MHSARKTGLKQSEIFYVFTGSVNNQIFANLIYRNFEAPTQFLVAIEGPASQTVDDALNGLLHVSMVTYDIIEEKNKPEEPESPFQTGGGKVDRALLKLKTSEAGEDTY